MRRFGVVRVVRRAPSCRGPRAATSWRARPRRARRCRRCGPRAATRGSAGRGSCRPRRPRPRARRDRPGTSQRFTANSSAIVISATASALRPGARSTGMPALVAASTSTLLGSPRHEPMHAQRQVEHRTLHRVGLDDQEVGALGFDPRRELLAVVEPQRDLLDPRVVDDVGERLQGVHALAAERRGDECSGSIRHVAPWSAPGPGEVNTSSSREGDVNVRFGHRNASLRSLTQHAGRSVCDALRATQATRPTFVGNSHGPERDRVDESPQKPVVPTCGSDADAGHADREG